MPPHAIISEKNPESARVDRLSLLIALADLWSWGDPGQWPSGFAAPRSSSAHIASHDLNLQIHHPTSQSLVLHHSYDPSKVCFEKGFLQTFAPLLAVASECQMHCWLHILGRFLFVSRDADSAKTHFAKPPPPPFWFLGVVHTMLRATSASLEMSHSHYTAPPPEFLFRLSCHLPVTLNVALP